MGYTLYFFSEEKNSDRAIELSKNKDIKYVDLRKLNKPYFIRGVPTLKDEETNQVYQGTGCFDKLELIEEINNGCNIKRAVKK